jgi:LPXTG-site transpeptidase (sortase) family protein
MQPAAVSLKHKQFTILRAASLSVFALALILAWFTFGQFFLAQLAYTFPDLNLHWAFRVPSVQATAEQQPATLVIPKINVTAPIVRNVSITDQAAYNTALETGVALAQGTAPLEATSGNSFIFGHSSKFTFSPTEYDTIFALLPKLNPDDTMQIISGNQTATYKVTLSKSVNTSDVQYISNGDTRELTLVTCWPAGTNFKRWVVQATKVN